MGGTNERSKDLEQAKARREMAEAAKRRTGLRMLGEGATIKDVMEAVHADRNTVKRWKEEMGNG